MKFIKNFILNNHIFGNSNYEEDIIKFIKNINRTDINLNYGNNLGIALFLYDKIDTAQIILEILKKQNALTNLTVFIDGTQGTRNYKNQKIIEIVKSYNVKETIINKGKFGFRKQMINSMEYLSENYEKIIFIEDDCIPSLNCIKIFDKELEKIKNLKNIFSVYGSPFLVKNEQFGGTFPRFQGWGWGTTSSKIKLILDDLKQVYMMSEKKYIEYINKNFNSEIKKKIDVTEKRMPSKTLEKFFAWDEVIGFLCAKIQMEHLLASERTFYPIMHEASVHFQNNEIFKSPPFNMFYKNEIKKILNEKNI